MTRGPLKSHIGVLELSVSTQSLNLKIVNIRCKNFQPETRSQNYALNASLSRITWVFGTRLCKISSWRGGSSRYWRHSCEEMCFKQRSILCVILTSGSGLKVFTPYIEDFYVRASRKKNLVRNLKVSDWVETLNSSTPIWDFSGPLVNFKK